MTTTHVATNEGLQLLAEHLNISLDELKVASEKKYEQKRIERLSAQIQQQKEAEAAALEKQSQQFMQAWENGHILVRCDGKIITKVGTLCKDGEPNMAPVIRRTMDTRRSLLQSFKGFTGNDASITRGATVSKEVTCTCGKTHNIEVFITSNK